MFSSELFFFHLHFEDLLWKMSQFEWGWGFFFLVCKDTQLMHVSALPKKCWHHMTRGLLHLVVISGWTQTSLTCWRFGVNWLRGSSPFHAPETASQPPFFFILQKHNSLNNISLLLCVANSIEAATFISSEHQNKPAHCKSSVASSVVQAVKSHRVNEDTTGFCRQSQRLSWYLFLICYCSC